jgi:hypothetical protein
MWGDMRRLLILALALGTLWLTGCSQEEADQARLYQAALDQGDEPDPELFHADVTLHRRYTGRKWLLDKDHIFLVKDESRIRATVAFANALPERIYSVHLAWVKPDGASAYHRYAEVQGHWVSLPPGAAADSTGALPEAVARTLTERWGDDAGTELARRLVADPEQPVWVAETTYKKAEDLSYSRGRASLDQSRSFEVTSVLNISREKERPLGDYRLQVYLDRRLLFEVPFVIDEAS